MILRRIRRSYEKNRNELLGLVLGRYPRFVRSDVDPETIPVFQFHGVSPSHLEPLLQHLHRNGYETLNADQYHDRMTGAERRRDREVLLTFDDGEASLYETAFPLLRSYGQQAVAYVVSGRVPEEGVYSGPGHHSLCHWGQLREMHESGAIDIQSHSLLHHSIAVSSRVVDFAHPGLSASFLASDLAPSGIPVDDNGMPCPESWGYPIHQWGARMGGRPAFKESPEAEQACVRHVADHGGAEFFNIKGWRKRLFRVLTDARGRHPPAGFESQGEQREKMLYDLRQSGLRIERKLSGKRVRHYCYPWYLGSELAVMLSREAGYVTNAWASLLPGFAVHPGDGVLPIARLAPRYIWRLPGNGRRRLLDILSSI